MGVSACKFYLVYCSLRLHLSSRGRTWGGEEGGAAERSGYANGCQNCRAVAVIILIGRSKLVPDFALTMHGLHLVITSLYTGRIPRNAMWWGAMAVSSSTCVALAIWGSRYRELRPISFGGNGASAGGGGGEGGAGAAQNGSAGGDEESGIGFSRGRGRGRGRDGEGGYEMVGMDHERRDS